jgi:hypothetical protein
MPETERLARKNRPLVDEPSAVASHGLGPRVVKPGGCLIIIAEFYNGGKYAKYADRLSRWTSMAVLDVAQHERAFLDAGFIDGRIVEQPRAGWICGVGQKPAR